jgi:hypothetical protein
LKLQVLQTSKGVEVGYCQCSYLQNSFPNVIFGEFLFACYKPVAFTQIEKRIINIAIDIA